MRTKAELYRQAMHMVASRRQTAVTQAEQRKETANAAVPGLAEAQRKVQMVGFRSLQLAAKGSGAGALNDTKAQRLAAQQELDNLLAQHGYSAESFVPKYTCIACKDTGFHQNRPCDCVVQLTRQLRREEISMTSPLALCRFDNMDLSFYPNAIDPATRMNVRQCMQENISFLQEYAESFDLCSTNLLLTGNAGLGKTHAALSIAQIVLDNGYDVVYLSAQTLFSQLERDRFVDENPLLEAVLAADLLILDDLGTEFVSAYVLSCFYHLLNTRLVEKRPTIYTTNIVDGKAFETRYTEKIASRLGGSCEAIFFVGEDIRKLKNA